MIKKQSQSHSTFTAVALILLMLCSNALIYAQNDATKRLYLAVIGYQLNEAAAKDALEAGADINWKNDAMNGENMLIMAIKGYQEAKSVKFLLENGADPNVKDDSGMTALEWARKRDIGRDRNGREIIAMLEAATGQTTKAKTTDTAPNAETETSKKTAPKTTTTTDAVSNKPRRTGGAPTTEEVKETMEKSFTNIYESHFFGVKNKVTFEWADSITIGAIQTIKAAPKPCYPVKLKVSVTAEDPRDGNRSTVVRGLDSTTGNYKEEIFCFYRDGFGEWNYGTYGK